MKKAVCCLLEGPKTNWISKCLQLRKFEVSLEGAGGSAVGVWGGGVCGGGGGGGGPSNCTLLV